MQRWLVIIFLSLSAWSCANGTARIDFNEPLEADRLYLKDLDHVTRDKKVISNFETKYTVSVTYLSPEFRKAFSKRYQDLFDDEQPFLEEASSKAGFFATIFTPERNGYDLTDDQLWSIQLKAKDGTQKPILIKRLNDKDRWRPFFKDVNQWSQEYLILFDTPSVSTSDKLVEKNALQLQLANADAKVVLSW